MAEGGRGQGRVFRGNRTGPRTGESSKVCKFYLRGTCYYGESCRFLHVDNNYERNDNRTHSQQKVRGERKPKPTSDDGTRSNHQLGAGRKRGVEASLAVQRSRGKSCGICYEEITQKPVRERVFGILSNCNHCFCLACIRKWRQADNFEFDHKITRTCPECRVLSNFFCPSSYWVENKVEKENLLRDYKKSLSEKDCKYFKSGGRCPYGDRCYYKHSSTVPRTVPCTVPRTVPCTVPRTVPSTVPSTVPRTVPRPVPSTVPRTVPRTEVHAPIHPIRPIRQERRNFDYEIAVSRQVEEVEIHNSEPPHYEDWLHETEYVPRYRRSEESTCHIL